MPTINPATGRQDGNANRRRAAENKAKRARLAALDPALAKTLPEFRGVCEDADEPDPVPLTVDAPPWEAGIDNAMVWASTVVARAAVHARRQLDPTRVRVVGHLAKILGSLRLAASDSEQSVLLAREYQGVVVNVTIEDPPEDPAMLPVWAFWTVIRMMHESATKAGPVDEGRVKTMARSLEVFRHVLPQAAQDAHVRAARKARETGKIGKVQP